MIARDKKVHIIAGALAGFTGGWLAYVFIHKYMIIAAVGLALIAGLLKEVYDIKKTGFDKMDLLATVIGGIVAAAVWFGCSFLRGF